MMERKPNGFFLPFTVFLSFLVVNIVIFVVLCNLNLKKFYNDKNKYYHFFIYEERAKNHIQKIITENTIKNRATEVVYYDRNYIFYRYQLDYSNNLWIISYQIYYEDYLECGKFYYDLDTHEMTMEIT